MKKAYFVTATSTNVGKTVVSSILCNIMAKASKNHVAYYKPVQTGCYIKDGELRAPDVEFVKAVNRDFDNMTYHTSYLFNKPASPHLSSRLERIPISTANIKDDYSNIITTNDYVIVEGAGGLYVPLDENGAFMSDLPQMLDLPIILVGNAELGAINSIGLSYSYIASLGLRVEYIVLLSDSLVYSDIEQDNLQMLKKLLDFDKIFILPKVLNCDTENCKLGNINEVIKEFAKCIIIK